MFQYVVNLFRSVTAPSRYGVAQASRLASTVQSSVDLGKAKRTVEGAWAYAKGIASPCLGDGRVAYVPTATITPVSSPSAVPPPVKVDEAASFGRVAALTDNVRSQLEAARDRLAEAANGMRLNDAAHQEFFAQHGGYTGPQRDHLGRDIDKAQDLYKDVRRRLDDLEQLMFDARIHSR